MHREDDFYSTLHFYSTHVVLFFFLDPSDSFGTFRHSKLQASSKATYLESEHAGPRNQTFQSVRDLVLSDHDAGKTRKEHSPDDPVPASDACLDQGVKKMSCYA